MPREQNGRSLQSLLFSELAPEPASPKYTASIISGIFKNLQFSENLRLFPFNNLRL